MNTANAMLSMFEQSVARFKRYALVYEQRIIDGIAYSRSQLDILVLITQNAGHTTSRLAGELLVSSGAITQTVDSLIKRGLVYRMPDISDKRVIRLMATDAGRQVAKAYQTQQRLLLQKWLNELTTQEANALLKALDKLAAITTKSDI